MKARVAWGVFLFGSLGGCSPAPEPRVEDGPSARADGAASAQTTTVDAPPPTTADAPSARPEASAPRASASAVAGPACANDGQCRWNDDCFPRSCGIGKPQPRACDESAPEPGACRCLGGRCAVVYKGTSGRCSRDADCAWDDACNPNVCALGKTPPYVGCDKSHPAPGKCLCVNHVCASVAP